LFDLDGKLVSNFSGSSQSHFANFLKAVRSRQRTDLNADILEGHQSTALCQIGNISWRLGRPVSLREIQEALGRLKVHENVRETLDRTAEHLRENKVDLEQTKLTLGALLQPDPEREVFLSNPRADAFLTREYRKPFVVPSESKI